MTDNNLSDKFAPQAGPIPGVYESTPQGERGYDLFSRMMKDRIIFIAGPVTMESSLVAVAQLLFLAKDPAAKEKGIDMYIMSPGGAVDGGSAILDAMDFLKNKGITIRTTAMGLAMSMGSALLVNGTPGERRCLPSTRIMLHEPAGGAQGKVADMQNVIAESNHMKLRMAALYKLTTKMSDAQVSAALNGPDAYMYGEEAKALGVIDDVYYPDAEHMMAIAQVQKSLAEHHHQNKTTRKESEANLFPVAVPSMAGPK